MQIQIVRPGLMTSIQDLGRQQFRDQGVPVSGAMDSLSARLANLVLGNDQNDAVIEFTYADAIFKTETDVLICWTGNGAVFKVDETNIPPARPVFIPGGTIVKLIHNPLGSRSYLAVAGGWDVPPVFGSRSTYITARFGGHNGRILIVGDVLINNNKLSALTEAICNDLKGVKMNYPKWNAATPLLPASNRKIIRVIAGREFDWFDIASIGNLLSKPFTLGNESNRMGYRLNGPAITRLKNMEMLSTAVTPGTIQVTNDNELIMLMADCQTTGGYPRIAQVAAVDMPLCGQLKPGDEITFIKIERKDAEAMLFKQASDMIKLAAGVRNKYKSE